MNRQIERIFFMDGVCPRCGQSCGNGGVGDTLRCQCGWVGEIAVEDAKVIREIIQRNIERNGGGNKIGSL